MSVLQILGYSVGVIVAVSVAVAVVGLIILHVLEGLDG